MRMFLKMLLSICMGIVVLSTGAIAVGRAQTSVGFTGSLDVCEGGLCYMGIYPGKTTWAQALKLLDGKPGIHVNQVARIATLTGGPVRTVHFYTSSRDVVTEMDFVFNSSEVTAGHVVAKLGTPCSVYQIDTDFRLPEILILAYPKAAIWVPAKDWALHPASPGSQFDIGYPLTEPISAAPKVRRQSTDPCWGSQYPERFGWKGFKRYAK